MAPRRPKGTGRKKIEIRRIESKQARQVCFSKRRVGLFKKATELATICGGKVAAVAFSPGRNVFTFGHPSVDSVLHRFYSSETQVAEAAGGGDDGGGNLNQVLAEAAGGGDDGGGDLNQALVEAAGDEGDGGGDLNQALADLNQEQDELRGRLEAEKARRDAAEEVVAKARAEGCQTTAWLNSYVIQMGEENLAFEAVLAKVHAAVAARAGQVLQEALLTQLRVHGGGGGFEFGGTSSGMETETMNKLHMIMATPPPLPGYAPGMERTPQGFGPHGFPQ
ncbi:hypothetical protein ACQ4PT_059581 [Festuca glaucescens]